VKENIIAHNETGKLVFELWEKCDLAVFGVGMIENGTLLSPKLVSSGEMDELKKLNAIGDILGHCFTAEGEFIQSELEDRLVSIPIELLKRIKARRAAVVGEEKIPAILGALKTGLINEIFTDRHTASLLCK
jgi:DNA-binding transcriptional regulator LsrR (DeoR family)